MSAVTHVRSLTPFGLVGVLALAGCSGDEATSVTGASGSGGAAGTSSSTMSAGSGGESAGGAAGSASAGGTNLGGMGGGAFVPDASSDAPVTAADAGSRDLLVTPSELIFAAVQSMRSAAKTVSLKNPSTT